MVDARFSLRQSFHGAFSARPCTSIFGSQAADAGPAANGEVVRSMLIVEVPVQKLTPEHFAPFGQIIGERPERPILVGPAIRSWRMPLDMDGPAELVVVRFEHRPFECAALERHLAVSQCFAALGDVPSIMVVAAPTDPDDPESVPAPGAVRAFFVPAGLGILLWRGTWHALNRFPVRRQGGAFLMVSEARTQREVERQIADGTPPARTQVVDFAQRAGATFRIVDPHELLPPV
jgi:ureidoglycolate lyase